MNELNRITCFTLLVFSDVNITEGSVETYRRYGGISDNHLIANLLLILLLKGF